MDARHVDVLLVGGGVASARCARTLRRQGFTGTILLVSDEETPPYNRPPLSKELLREDLPTELTLAEPMSWYERRGVELQSLHRESLGWIRTRGPRPLPTVRSLAFGQLLLATGAEPRRPSLPGRRARSPAAHAAGRGRAARSGGGRGAGGGDRRRVHRGGGGVIAGRARTVRDRPRAEPRVVGRNAWTSGCPHWAVARLEEAGVTVRMSAPVSSIGPRACQSRTRRLRPTW